MLVSNLKCVHSLSLLIVQLQMHNMLAKLLQLIKIHLKAKVAINSKTFCYRTLCHNHFNLSIIEKCKFVKSGFNFTLSTINFGLNCGILFNQTSTDFIALLTLLQQSKTDGL